MIFFGFFKGMNHSNIELSEFDEFRNYKNSISKIDVIEYMNNLEAGMSCAPSKDMFTGEELEAGIVEDGDFIFPYEFIHYYMNYDIGIPYEYEKHIKNNGVGK